MSKITNNGLTRSGTGCFIAVPMWHHWASKGYATIPTLSGLTRMLAMNVAITSLLIDRTELVQFRNNNRLQVGVNLDYIS